MNKVIFNNLTVPDLVKNKGNFREIFEHSGILVFPGILKNDPLFLEYRNDLGKFFDFFNNKTNDPQVSAETLDEKLTALSKTKVESGKYIADLGTQPIKLVSGNRFKFRDEFIEIARTLFGDLALLGTPAAGDTLHLFPPSEKFFQYNLPIHQDYQYLMQSPQQLTFWINMGATRADVGGVTFWLGSHKPGIAKSTKNKLNQFQTVVSKEEEENFQTLTISAGEGDLVIMHSLLWHRSDENYSKNHSRIAQIFRFSDLRDSTSEEYLWRSTSYNRALSLKYEDQHSDLFVENDKN